MLGSKNIPEKLFFLFCTSPDMERCMISFPKHGETDNFIEIAEVILGKSDVKRHMLDISDCSSWFSKVPSLKVKLQHSSVRHQDCFQPDMWSHSHMWLRHAVRELINRKRIFRFLYNKMAHDNHLFIRTCSTCYQVENPNFSDSKNHFSNSLHFFAIIITHLQL